MILNMTSAGREAQNISSRMPSDPVIDTDMPDTIAPIPQRQLENNLQGASTSTSSPSSTSKRRKISSLGIFDLPDIAFVRISSFLCTPSRALLALSLTTDSKSWRKYKWSKKKVSPMLAWANVKRYEPSDQTKVIIASQKWESLDFGELNTEGEVWPTIGMRLNDNDISGILACINAKENLKTLKIKGCINIKGWGLQLLSGSVMVREIDLAQKIYSQDPGDFDSDQLSEDVVLPILDSIINTPGNSLALIQLPRRWRKAMSPELHSFLLDYDRLLESRQVRCSKCTVGLWGDYVGRGEGNGWFNCYNDPYHEWEIGDGMQNHTCIKCTNFFCYECDNGVNGKMMLRTCTECNEECCHDCVPMTECVRCSLDVCVRCSKKCPNCETHLCSSDDCREYMRCCDTCHEERCQRCSTFLACRGGGCDIVQCVTCCNQNQKKESVYNVDACDTCWTIFCDHCRYSKLREDWGNACSGCIKLIADDLGKMILKDKQDQEAKHRDMRKRHREEVKKLRLEIEGLRMWS